MLRHSLHFPLRNLGTRRGTGLTSKANIRHSISSRLSRSTRLAPTDEAPTQGWILGCCSGRRLLYMHSCWLKNLFSLTVSPIRCIYISAEHHAAVSRPFRWFSDGALKFGSAAAEQIVDVMNFTPLFLSRGKFDPPYTNSPAELWHDTKAKIAETWGSLIDRFMDRTT